MVDQRAERALGIDIGGTFVKSVLLDAESNVAARREDPVRIASVDALIAQLLDLASALDPGRCATAMGVAIAGLVESRSGRVAASPHLPGLRDFEARAVLGGALGRDVLILNDATAATFAEATMGAARGYSNVLMFTAGTGVGGGLVIDGRPYGGASGFAGEIGHVPIDDGGDPCACGRHGCLETAVGAKYLVARARAAIAAGVESRLGALGVEFTTADIFKACAEGDALAGSIVTRAGRALGRASAIALQILNLDRIVLGGGLARSADLLVPLIIGEAQARTFPQIFSRATFAAAELGHWAGALGAAKASSIR